MRVYVLLFNARTENEGIHTVNIGDRSIVLMFEAEDDAERFGVMLEAQDFPVPTVEEFDSEEIEEYCQSADYDCKLIPSGALIMPPETNVEETEWQLDQERPTETRSNESDGEEKSEFSESELEAFRRRLEGLL